MREIPLTQGKTAVIDDQDWELVKSYSWWATRNRRGNWYAKASPSKRTNHKRILMHRLILGLSPSERVDHIDRDGLNNRRENLRVATAQQNKFNQKKRCDGYLSLYKGVTPRFYGRGRHGTDGTIRCWRARIFVEGRSLNLGQYEQEIEAALGYDRAARRYFGEFACCNFPETAETSVAPPSILD